MLKLEHICKTYNKGTVNETTLFSDFNLQVKKGEFISVIGSNGSGKTSILNLICGMILRRSWALRIRCRIPAYKVCWRNYG